MMNTDGRSTKESQGFFLFPFCDWLCNPSWPERWSNRIMLVIFVLYFFGGILLWEVVSPRLAETLDLIALAILSALWIGGDEILSRIPGNEDRRPAFATRAVRWVRRHWPERRINQLAILILITFVLIPEPLWESANRQLGGALDFITLPSLLTFWLIGDEFLSRRPGNEDRKPAFAVRLQQRLWPYRPRRRFNQVAGVFFLATLSYAMIVPFSFTSYAFFDASFTLEILFTLGAAEVWLVYVLARCWADPECRPMRLLTRLYGFLAYALISLLVVVSLATQVTNDHGITSLHVSIIFVGFGLLVVSALTPESLLRDTDEAIERRLFPCLTGQTVPNWW